jgi:hypothetical protein
MLFVASTVRPAFAETAPMRAGDASGKTSSPYTAPAGSSGTAAATTMHGKVLETMNAGNYTYARVETPAGEKWIAGPQTPLKVGDMVEWPAGIEMKGFASKTLGRKFDSIDFVDRLGVGGSTATKPQDAPHGAMSGKAADDVPITGVTKADGGLTIAEIYDGRSKIEGKEIVVRGKVVKANAGVMGRNWIHLRDGSHGAAGENDLTVTSGAAANVGDTVLVRGKVVLNKDFGFGYRYDVMLEDAKVTVETAT